MDTGLATHMAKLLQDAAGKDVVEIEHRSSANQASITDEEKERLQ